jgi:hypothetical protein
VHVSGSVLIWIAALRLMFATRDRGPLTPAAEPGPGGAESAGPESGGAESAGLGSVGGTVTVPAKS